MLQWAIALTLCAASPAEAQLPPVITDLGPADLAKSERQRALIATLASRHLGTPMRGGDERDLDVLQRLLDQRVVAHDDVAGLQALGLALGDVMASNLSLQWVVIDDEFGRSRALRFGESDHLFFPVTMISKRVANREPVRVRELFAEVVAAVDRLDARLRPRRRPLVRPPRPQLGVAEREAAAAKAAEAKAGTRDGAGTADDAD